MPFNRKVVALTAFRQKKAELTAFKQENDCINVV